MYTRLTDFNSLKYCFPVPAGTTLFTSPIMDLGTNRDADGNVLPFVSDLIDVPDIVMDLLGVPEFPEFPDFPEFPEMPEFPEFPEMPEFPKFPEMPEFPKFPEMPEFPEISGDGEVFDEANVIETP